MKSQWKNIVIEHAKAILKNYIHDCEINFMSQWNLTLGKCKKDATPWTPECLKFKNPVIPRSAKIQDRRSPTHCSREWKMVQHG